MQNVRVFIHILPFGEMRLSYNLSLESETQKKEKSVYIKPFSTGAEGVKSIYMEETDKEDKVYKVPETTGLTSIWQTTDTTSNDMIYNESDTTSEERRWSPSEGGDHLCGEDTRKRCWLNGR